MEIVIVVFLLLLVIVLIMSIGVLFKGKPIKGSCGGLGALGMNTGCEICGGDEKKCDSQTNQAVDGSSSNFKQATLAYDAFEKV